MKLHLKLVFLFLFIASQGFGANYYWVGGTGNWSDINHWVTSSGGTVKHSVVPSPQDNVFFDGNSFSVDGETVTMNIGITTCRDLDLSGTIKTHSLSGITSAIKIFGSLKLSSLTSLNYNGDLFFEALSTGHTISTSGKHILCTVYFNGIGGGYTLMDSLDISNSVYLNYGALNTNGKTFRCNEFLSQNTNTRVLNISGSKIYTNAWDVTGTNLSLTSQNSIISIFNSQGEFKHLGTAIYYDVSFTNINANNLFSTTDATFHIVRFAGKGSINGNNTYDSLILGYGKTYLFEPSKTQTFILGLQACGHCSNRITLKSSTLSQAIFSKSSGTVIIDQAKLENISAVGGASFIANSSIDKGGNTGWIINAPTPLNLYWVGGNGDWDDTLHWSYTSGGPGGACIPRKTDNVFFDINSFNAINQTVMLAITDTSECHDMTWTATSWRPVFDGNLGVNLDIYGSLAFCQNLNVNYAGETRFKATTAGKTILMSGCSFPYPVYFEGSNGGWTLLDTFRTQSVLILNKGHLNTNSKTVYSYRFESISFNSKILTLGSSHFFVTGFGTNSTWYVDGTNITLNAGTSIIKLTADSAGMLNTNATQLVYHNVEFVDTGGLGIFTNSSTTFNRVSFWGNSKIFGVSIINDLMFYKNTYCEISPSQTQYILDSLIAFGDCTGKIMIYSSSQGVTTTFSKASGVINVDQVILKDIAAGGGAVFTATNSYDLGNNTNWIFTTVGISNRYWIGGTGNWDDTAHWSYSSGGPGGACVPTPSDNVFFDVNSFSATAQIVDINVGNATCRNMTWTGSLYNPEFSGYVKHNLRIFGSLTFVQAMSLTFLGVTYFEATTLGQTITSAGNVFNRHVIFRGLGGGWTFQDDFACSYNLIFLHGNLNFNRKNVYAASFISDIPNIRVLNIKSSNISLGTMIGNAWNLVATNLTFFSDSSNINIIGSYAWFLTSGTGLLNYWNVNFSSPQGESRLLSTIISCNFQKVAFYHSGLIYGTNSYDTLFFEAGTSNSLQSGYTQTVNTLIAIGNCNAHITFLSTPGGVAATFVKNSGNLVVDYVRLQDNTATGGATFTAHNSQDLGNNTGWTINQVTSKGLYWVNGTGKWNDSYHWSFTSGGPGGACIPGPIDDVYFDNNSFNTSNDTVYVNVNASCRNKTWSVTTSQPVFFTNYAIISIYGSLTFCNSMINAFLEKIYFKATTTGHTITSAGQNYHNHIIFDGQGGGWTLIDNMIATNGFIDLNNGSLNTNSKKVLCKTFFSNTASSRILTLGASEITIIDFGYSFVINTTNLTLNEGTSKFILLSGGVFAYFSGSTSGLKFYNIFFEGSGGTSHLNNTTQDLSYNHVFFKNSGRIIGNNFFDSLSFSANMLYQLDKDKPQTIIKHLRILGNNCFPITVQSTQMGYQATIIKSSGSVSGDFIHIRDIKASGGAVFYAGANSADVSNNSGWIFNNSPGYIFGLGKDTLVCSFAPFVLTTANFNGGTSFLWSTGDTTPSISIIQTGVYSVTVTYDNNCQVTDDIFIRYHNPPVINLGQDTLICEGKSITLDPGLGFANYLWSNGSTNNQLNVTSAGIYNVSVQDTNGCLGNDSIKIGIFPLPHINLGKNTYLCLNASITLIAQPGYDSSLWQDGSKRESSIVNEPGTYYLIVTN
ncbi:MAG: hypothetical protein H8E98_03450, partial [Bacteroidetes bacterium]|nr:hypothetical protein [Bacteroidota bacterium]